MNEHTLGPAYAKELARRREKEVKKEPKKEARKMSLEEKTDEFWKFFRTQVSEWNPCHIDEDGRVRYRWDEDVGAHDVEVDVEGSNAADSMECGVCLESYCPDVGATPHTVRLGSLLERVLMDEKTGRPREVVDLRPVR